MAEQVFGARDIRGDNYSGPPKAQEVAPAVQVQDTEMVEVTREEEQVPAVPAQPAPRLECASL